MSVFEDFTEEILFLDEIDVGNCILSDNKTTMDTILRQIWDGSRSLIDKLILMGRWFDDELEGNQCGGVKDILNDWNKNNIKTFIIYVPRSTAKTIRKKLSKKISTKIIAGKIESYLSSQSRRNVKDMAVYSLDDENYEIGNIFDIEVLRDELDKSTKGSDKIFFIGLKYDLSSREVNVYLNNIPIAEESGLILGNSKILKHKLKKGIMEISVDEDVTIEFFDTNVFTSRDDDIGDDLKDIDFERDSIDINLEYASSLRLESKREKSLTFSTEGGIEVDEEEFIAESEDEDIVDNSSILKKTKVNMDSFFIPKNRELKGVNLLLLEKDGENIIAGGQYHSGLSSCNILAELIIDFNQESMRIKNHSNDKLSFSNYTDFWKLEEFSTVASSNYNAGIYTELLSPITSAVNNNIDGLTEVGNLNVESTLIIEKGDEHTFEINQIEFNDSNVSFDKSGVLIRYSSFCIAEFEKEFALHRTAYRMSGSGTMIDCFVSQPSKGVFEYGGRVYDDSTSILGVLISSKPIYFRHTRTGLEIDATALVARGYTVQISASSNKYPLKDKYNAKKILKKNEMKNVEIEVINRSLNKPLIEFSLEFY
jgi:hypothetical protein